MDIERFRRHITSAVLDIIALEKKKGNEYIGKWEGEVDRFSQFKRIAQKRETIPENVLIGMVVKHWDWILENVEKMVESYKRGETVPAGLLLNWQEKTRDVIVYMLLLEGLIIDRIEQINDSNEKGGII